MHVSTMVRGTVVAGVLATATACGDGPVEPGSRIQAPARASAALAVANVQITTFTVDPGKSGSYSFGPHRVYFPANSICDPKSSGYGEDMWDKGCRPLNKPIVIKAAWTLRNDHAVVELEPALRFVPAAATDTARWVILTLHEPLSLESGTRYGIAWLRPWDLQWVDESLRDPTLRAWVDGASNNVSRRLKHFSGYNVTAGFAQTTQTVCEWSCDDAGLGRVIP